jgi:hypothetical protein
MRGFCGLHGCGDAFAGERLGGVDAKLDLADQSSAFNRACYAGSARVVPKVWSTVFTSCRRPRWPHHRSRRTL